jgi:hypothetical protein
LRRSDLRELLKPRKPPDDIPSSFFPPDNRLLTLITLLGRNIAKRTTLSFPTDN